MIRPKKPPFSGSTVDAYKTKGQIDRLLREYGCEAAQWTEDFENNVLELRFIAEVEYQGQKRKLGVKLVPPLFMQTRSTWNATKGRHEKKEAPNFSQSMRVLFWYVKAKLAAVAYGVRPFEEEFLSDIIIHDEQGEKRLIDVLKERAPDMLGLPDMSKAGTRAMRIIEPGGEDQAT